MNVSRQDWPKPRYDNQIMINKCKQCLASMQCGDNILPRLEILDYCAAMLLNLNEINSLMQPDKRFPSFELYSAFANAIFESENFKTKKICRDAWDLVVPMFMQSNKRGGGGGAGGQNMAGGGGGNNSRDSPSLIISSNLTQLLKRLRNVPS